MKQFLLAFFLLTSFAFTQNLILNSSNNALRANFYGNTALDLKGLPLGTSDGTATGEVGVKVKVVGSISTTPNIQLGTGVVTATTTRVTLSTDGPGVTSLNTIATNTAVQFGGGVNTATTQRVTLASDGPGVANLVTIANNTTGGTTAGATLVSSTAYESSRIIKSSAGTLISIVGYNSSAAAQFIQVYNSATVPANAAVPIYTFTAAATSNFSLDVPLTGAPFTTGISVSNSRTGPTKTSGGNDCFFTAVIK